MEEQEIEHLSEVRTMEARLLIREERLLEEVEHRDMEEREEELQLTERKMATLAHQLLPRCLLLLQLRMVEGRDGKRMNGEQDRIALLHLQLL